MTCTIQLDGFTLTPEDLVKIGYDTTVTVELTDEAWTRVDACRQVIDDILERKEVVYGINTGFGLFESTIIDESKLLQLQTNLITSHASGVGEPLEPYQTRMMLALRINILAHGNSGIRQSTVRLMLEALNKNCLSVVPQRGTVGASGDLAPLSHLALGLMGMGKMWDPRTGKQEDAAKVLEAHGITPIVLAAKEGLALINGTQLIASIGSESVVRAELCCKQADVVAAMTIEALHGSCTPFHPRISGARPHKGQIKVAARVAKLLNAASGKSEVSHSHINCSKVQDAYSFRCHPQVLGICNETVDFVHGIISQEINSATDNPMVFADMRQSERFHRGQKRKGVSGIVDEDPLGCVLSGGNFHGEYPAKAMDYLAIGIHEVANISERRIERMCNPQLSNLPAFLVNGGGLNSGFMIAHCTAASLVSENKVLTHPASVDSISTSGAQEDHVSMGGFAARKALQVVKHVEYVMAIELLAACQAMEFRRPLKTTPLLEKVHALVRTVAAPWDSDRYMTPDIEAVCELLKAGKIWDVVKSGME